MGAILDNTAYEQHLSMSSDRCSNGKIKLSELMKLHEKIGELHLNVFGSDSNELRNDHHVAFIFTKIAILVHRLPRENESIVLRTWCSGLKGVRFTRNYQSFDSDGNVLTESKCEMTIIDLKSRRIVRPISLPGFEGHLYNDEIENRCEAPKKIALPDDMTVIGTHRADDRDIDQNGHVNNTVYADIMTQFIPEEYSGSDIKSIEINYISEVLPHEEIKLSTSSCDGQVVFSGATDNRTVFSGVIRF